MLVLTRRVNQRIKIGEDIEVMVVAMKGDDVRIGITAPRDVAVDREEIRISKDARRKLDEM